MDRQICMRIICREHDARRDQDVEEHLFHLFNGTNIIIAQMWEQGWAVSSTSDLRAHQGVSYITVDFIRREDFMPDGCKSPVVVNCSDCKIPGCPVGYKRLGDPTSGRYVPEEGRPQTGMQ